MMVVNGVGPRAGRHTPLHARMQLAHTHTRTLAPPPYTHTLTRNNIKQQTCMPVLTVLLPPP
jgi:hypothetical protein